MKFTSLRYFLAVASELNISKVSQKLYITQQSLSEQISRLENEYHVKLFNRKPRLSLTYAGQRMVEFAQEVLELERRFKNELADISTENSGSLSIGVRTTHSRILLPELLPLYMEKHPNIKLKITASVSRELTHMLSSGKIDLAIASERFMNDPNFISVSLPQDSYYMVVPENILKKCTEDGAPLPKDITELDFGKLAGVPLILLEENTLTRTAADYLMALHGIADPEILLECRHAENAMLACSRGLGVTFVLGAVFHHFVHNTVQHEHLYGFPFETPTVEPGCVISCHRYRPLSNAGRDFIDMAQEVYARIISGFEDD